MDKPKILIVEDELLIAKNTASRLESFGYEVSKIVTSGQAAIDYITSVEQPNLILMDIAIKGDLDGIETATQIKSTHDIPIIFLTAYASDDTLDRASQTGCYGYLIKPFRAKELQATIKMTLSKHQEQSAIQQALQHTVSEYSTQYDDIYKDTLTNLPNKLFLRDIFNYCLSFINDHTGGAALNGESSISDERNRISLTSPQIELVAVFNISLDRLKKISNLLTKQQQDKLVLQIVERLNSCVESFDFQGATVYLEADNYLILTAIDKRQTATNYGQIILNSFKQAFNINNQEIFLALSIGVAFYPSDNTDIEILLQQSQKAVEYARQQGSNRCQLFTFAFNISNSKSSENITMEAELHYALERKEFELYYQPKVNLNNNIIVGAEALLRWNHPVMGRISPDKFITIVEESGLIKPIGEWILHTAIRQVKSWQDNGLSSLCVGINISGFQFRQSDLFHQITQILFNTSLEPQCIELELTEKILVENIKTNIQRLQLIKKLGIKIALDDFGTGYSSLGYLQQFPFDILKIDACFIHNIDSNTVNAVITKTIIEMAHKLNLKVVAEGVETQGELNFLKEAKCDEIQGYLFSRPLNAQDFYKLAIDNLAAKNKVK
ncbi:response regulator receiver modulated diguanylate cyclase/phosphodiesterase [Chondrocystis sp. NIES-4102]|nr:response regulator receiver modulated diguanylate cyclase/phosphodiesterase [Chondrocystis sp. NIES-4102]